jgi:hypothetical protein
LKHNPKILLGSKAKRGLGRVVEYCDGWMPLGGPGMEMQLAEGVKELLPCASMRAAVSSHWNWQ